MKMKRTNLIAILLITGLAFLIVGCNPFLQPQGPANTTQAAGKGNLHLEFKMPNYAVHGQDARIISPGTKQFKLYLDEALFGTYDLTLGTLDAHGALVAVKTLTGFPINHQYGSLRLDLLDYSGNVLTSGTATQDNSTNLIQFSDGGTTYITVNCVPPIGSTVTLSLGAVMGGQTVSQSDIRFYSIDLAANTPYIATISPTIGSPDMYLFNVDGHPLANYEQGKDYVYSNGLRRQLAFTTMTAGTFYLGVYGYSGADYALSVQAAQIDLRTGLVGEWLFNGSANDTSGSGNNGTVNAATLATDRFGNANAAYSFNGATISVSNLGVETSAGGHNTVSFWLKKDASQDGTVPFCWSNVGYDLLFWSGGFGFNTYNNEVYGAADTMSVGTWYHVVADFYNGVPDSANSKLYINGVEQSISLIVPGTGQASRSAVGEILLGALSGGANYFNGSIDDVRVYNRELNPAEVQALYHQAGVSTGPVGEWLFNGNANDTSGNGNNGTLFGETTLTTDRFGNANQAYSFDGDADYIQASANPLPTADRTVSLWFNTSSMLPPPGMLGYGGGDSVGMCWIQGLNMAGNGGYTMQGHGGANWFSYSYTEQPLNRWVHWVITTDPSGSNMYVDGVLVASNPALYVNNTNVNGKILILGGVVGYMGNGPYTDAAVGWMNGSLDDIRIYCRALSDSEIQTLYHEGGWAEAPKTSWNAADDFSATNNPNGPWSSGWRASDRLLSTDFNLFTQVFPQSYGSGWRDPANSASGAPNCVKNTSSVTAYGVAPGQVALHPGPSGEYALLRWIAPRSGTFQVNAQFLVGNDGETDASVVLNGVSQWYALTTSTNPTFSQSLSMNQSDFLDFAVGPLGDFGSDSTPVVVTISEGSGQPQVIQNWDFKDSGFSDWSGAYQSTSDTSQYLNNSTGGDYIPGWSMYLNSNNGFYNQSFRFDMVSGATAQPNDAVYMAQEGSASDGCSMQISQQGFSYPVLNTSKATIVFKIDESLGETSDVQAPLILQFQINQGSWFTYKQYGVMGYGNSEAVSQATWLTKPLVLSSLVPLNGGPYLQPGYTITGVNLICWEWGWRVSIDSFALTDN
jgi:hypothetical protein